MKLLFKILLALVSILIILFVLLRFPDKTLEELKGKYADQNSEWLTLNGMNVHYKKEGSGPPLLLIHGTGASLHTWDGWTEKLKKDFSIYRMDLPAYGLTGPEPNADYSMQMYSDFIHEFSAKLGIDTFAIAGNSLGGYISWVYAVDHPEKVYKMILIDPAGYPSEEPSKALVFQLANNPLLRPLLKHITPKNFVRKNLEQVYANDERISDELVDRYHDLALRVGNRQAFIDRIQTVGQDLSGKISKVQCPTLIQWGQKDTWILPSNGKRFEADINDAELIIYEDLGHVPMEEDPKKTAEDALHFLK